MSNPDSPWSHKPWWCQPWSILLTGGSLIAAFWTVFGSRWPWILLSGALSVPVLAWMGFFVLVWPRLMRAENFAPSEPSSGDSP